MAKNYNEYSDLGVKFLYPRNWFVRTETLDKGTYRITVDTPEGSFWVLSIYPKGVDLDAAAKEAVNTLSAEYDQLEKSEVKKYVADYELSGYEVDFFYLDLTSTATALKFEDERRGYVIYWQTCDSLIDSDEELSRLDVFNAMTHTLVSNLTCQEADWDEDDDQDQFDKTMTEKEVNDLESREFFRRKYEQARVREQERMWRGENEPDDQLSRAIASEDENLRDFLRVSEESSLDSTHSCEEEERHYYDSEFDEKECCDHDNDDEEEDEDNADSDNE